MHSSEVLGARDTHGRSGSMLMPDSRTELERR